MSEANICIWGDSIAYGAWDAQGGWADRLRMFLHSKTIESEFTDYYWVYNLGIPGETSTTVLDRFDSEISARDPHVVIFAFGTNDSRRTVRGGEREVELERFSVNTSKLIYSSHAQGAEVFVVGTSVVDESRTLPFDGHSYFAQSDLDEYNKALKQVVENTGAHFIEVRHVLEKSDLIDGLHPNDMGHSKIFSSVKNVLAECGTILRGT